MKRMHRWSVRLAVAGALFSLLGGVLLGAQDPPAAEQAAPVPRLRLPAYYSRVVSPEQREQIYGILRDYEEKLTPLREQIQQLETERAAAVEKVLDAEQLAEIQKLVEEARLRRLERTVSRTPPGEPEESREPGGGKR